MIMKVQTIIYINDCLSLHKCHQKAWSSKVDPETSKSKYKVCKHQSILQEESFNVILSALR